MSRIIILHEYGENTHYSGVIDYAERNNIKLSFIEFDFIRTFVCSIRDRNVWLFYKLLRDFILLSIFFIFPSLLKKHTCIVGIAPYDWRVFFVNRVLQKTRYIYHTSWPYWDGSKYPKKFFCKSTHREWSAFLSNAKHTATVTDFVKNNLNFNYPLTSGKTEVVYHSFDERLFFPRFRQASAKLNVIYLGRLEESKGIYDVLQLIKTFPDVCFKIIGKGKLVDIVLLSTKKFKNLNYIGHLNDKNEIAKTLRECDILLLPSKRTENWEELFGMVLIEAMACGCIPLTVDHVGPSAILQNTGLDKFLFKEKDYIESACEWLQIFNNDINVLNFYKIESVNVAKKFRLKTISLRWENIIKKVAK